jgi:uncharacterized protein (DUF1778 family)
MNTKRNKKNVRAPKEEVINVRMTTQQKATLDAAAAGEGLGLSTWLLRLGLVAVEQRPVEKRR